MVGSAAAYFLALQAPGLRVVVLEQDPSYTLCATTRSVASIRHQFSTPENIRMSMFGSQFLRGAAQTLAVDGVGPALGFHEGGYLFLATQAGVPVLRHNHAVQHAEGAQVSWLTAEALALRFPWLATNDLAAGTLGEQGEGWLDAHALLHGFRRKAVSLGVRFRHAQAVGLHRSGARITAVQLADGPPLRCGHVINAAGTGAATLARTAGIRLHVQARKRCVFHFSSPQRLPNCPLVIDPSGLYFRPEGQGFLCGLAPAEHEDPECHDFNVPLHWWEERLWPALAQRVAGFEAARLLSAWAGHYDVHLLDHNMILGSHPDIQNLLFANGFSGHGVQHAPAVGRALAELVLHSAYQTLDLSALGWHRVLAERPLRERNVV